MRDISRKITTLRTAVAQATLRVSPSTIMLIHENKIPKGNPLEVAKVAAIQGAKNTSQIIPYCHPLPIDFVGVEFTVGETDIVATVEVKAIYKTGVEMEALTAASIAALTLYDMMKMIDDEMEILGVKLLSKKGGKSDFTKLGGMKASGRRARDVGFRFSREKGRHIGKNYCGAVEGIEYRRCRLCNHS